MLDDKTTVYLIQGLNSYKIGATNNLPVRLKALQTGNHYKLRVLANTRPLDRDAAFYLEQSLHILFAHKRVYGEWFDLGPKDVSDIVELLSGKSVKRARKGSRFNWKHVLLMLGSLTALYLYATLLG